MTIDSDGCWLFNNDAEHYGQIKIGGQNIRVHRYVYGITHGGVEDGDGLHVHHTCEKPGCINPAHLVLLTPAEHLAAHRVAS